MSKQVKLPVICGKELGDGSPCFIIGEIGINHNGDLEIAKKLINVAADAGCNAVKFQKRTPEICVPSDQKSIKRETPWGYITYLDYRHKVEFGTDEYKEIDKYCKELDIMWTASCWDIPSVQFMEKFNPPFYKIASAKILEQDLLTAYRSTGRPLLVSTGMSTQAELDDVAKSLSDAIWIFLHCTSAYPSENNEINLKVMQTLKERYGRPVGYSGHEVGLQVSIAAVALGACVVERHITLDRTFWGSDQAASLEPQGLKRLVRDIRVVEKAMGDGVKRVYPSERAIRKKLRGS
jgi:N-acetylneuraminate synthase